MHASAFRPVIKSPSDEMSTVFENADQSPTNDDDFMPISVAIRLCPEAPSNQVRFVRLIVLTVIGSWFSL